METQSTSLKVQRMRKMRDDETPEQRETHLARDQERKRQKRALETTEEREARLARDHERKQKKRALETNEQHEERLKCQRIYHEKNNQNSRVTETHLNQNNDPQEGCSQNQNSMNTAATNNDEISASVLTESDQDQLKKFRNKMDKLKHNLCTVCKEYFPSIVLVKGKCRQCYNEKTMPKKFSAENNMDLGEVPEELKDIAIDDEIIQSLPINSPIDKQLKTISDNLDDDNEDEIITHDAIMNTLNRMQSENGAIA
ncbi:5767_t:CDS:2 [Racocetra fulgida]|uniref:5767_t:CDS:1 n=1 Tax=Racocetra fulgida TaxID=60492 RepID=A0A9N9CHQ1_9GLOM|nr:5767_t:CDS:2 [Racocetra fulgida]